MEFRPSLHLGVVPIEKGAFGSHSTEVADFTYLVVSIKMLRKDEEGLYLSQVRKRT